MTRQMRKGEQGPAAANDDEAGTHPPFGEIYYRDAYGLQVVTEPGEDAQEAVVLKSSRKRGSTLSLST